MDRELAEATLHDELPESSPPLSEFTPEVRALYAVADRLGVAVQFLAALAKSSYVPSDLPRARTARDDVKRDHGAAVHVRISAQLLPPD